MLFEYLRMFKYDGAAFTDMSLPNQDDAQTVAVDLGPTDFVYVAQYLPFNNLFFHMEVVNAVAAGLRVQVWDHKDWRDVVDVLDASAAPMGTPFAKSGTIQFQPDRDYAWQGIRDPSQNYGPAEMSTIKVYDCHWLRISADAPISFELKEMSYSLTTTGQLNDIDIEINKYYNSFATGKTDWIDEILTASKMVVSDLKSRGLLVHPGQILRFDDVSRLADYKALELIYRNLGTSYNDRKEEMRILYGKEISSKRFTFDDDRDGHVDNKEIFNKIKVIVR